MIYGFSCLKQFSGALVISGRGQILLTLGDFGCHMNPWQYCDNYVAIMWQHCENFVDILKRNSDNFWKTRIIATTILILDFFSLLTILTWMQNTNQKLCISGTGIKVVFFQSIWSVGLKWNYRFRPSTFYDGLLSRTFAVRTVHFHLIFIPFSGVIGQQLFVNEPITTSSNIFKTLLLSGESETSEVDFAFKMTKIQLWNSK